MSAPPLSGRARRWRGPPLAFQILGLLIGGLVVAQFVTLLLTILLPPPPPPQYGLDDIAAVLRGEAAAGGRLERTVQTAPPDLSGPGWLVSERSRRELAGLLGVGEDAVSLAFYTPLPFAGSAGPPPRRPMLDDGPIRRPVPIGADAAAGATPAVFVVDGNARLRLTQMQGPPGGGPPTTPPPGAGGPGAGGLGRPPRDSFPPGIAPGARPGDGVAPSGGILPSRLPPPRRSGEGGLFAIDPTPLTDGGILIPGDGGAAVPPLLQSPDHRTLPPLPPGVVPDAGRRNALPGATQLPPIRDPAIFAPAPRSEAPLARVSPDPAPAPPPARAAAPAAPPTPAPPAAAAPPAPAPPAAPAAPPPPAPATAIAVTPPARGLFGFAPAPFVEGDFVAALRLVNGRWAIAQPVPEPFPTAWQRRLLLWFAVAFAIVAPLGWLFARRLVTPLGRFATAAETLGRDPAGTAVALDGPAEIGRAARAFNLMQGRLRSFVDDRTAMVGAISHDLRTPLTRLRFRIEDVPDEQREGMLAEVAEMEAMISSVLAFVRDASTPNVRERIDLAALVEDVVEDAAMIGRPVTIERIAPAAVEIDVLGMRRVLDNLIENAVKYGACGRIRLHAESGEAVVEILDDGPGLPADELERVFEPFYRGETARVSDRRGSGLGLAVCRSITRAHGGDVRLARTPDGFAAEVRIPLAYGAGRAVAA